MVRVISDTGIPDKSVGDRADRGHAIRFARGKFTVSAPAKVPVERRFFPLPPCKPTCHNCVAPIDATGRNRYRFRGRDGRTARIINGIGSNRFRYTITVTVTVMEEGGDNDGGNSDSSIFAELATQYRSDILRHLGRMDEKGSIVGNLCRLKLNRILF